LLVLSSFSKAERKLKRLGLKSIEGIIFHQDKGTIYTSASYTTEVLSSGAYLSYSAKGEPDDNAVNEAFFSRLKEERRDLFAEAETFEELKKLIKISIAYYNEYHTSLNNMTPAEFTKKQLKIDLTLKSINLVW
ncbi:MAG: integrase core domain-containing protein, partial [Candidatus Helarchaeota archaeon]